MSALDLGRDRRAGTGAVVVLLGALAGLVVGAVGTAIAIGWALFTTASSGVGQTVPLLIATHVVSGQITATSGDGIVVPAIVTTAVGALVALAVQMARRSR